MLASYVKVAFKVLLRRPFLTFVSLFGITVTLTVLILASAFIDSALNPPGAETDSDHVLAVDLVCFQNDEGTTTWNSGPGYRFHELYIEPMETPDRISFFTSVSLAVSYLDGQKVESRFRYTDVEYWNILQFEFLEGRPIGADDYAEGRPVVVINRSTRDRFFPEGPALGEKLTANGQSFTVIGVVEDESELSKFSFADFWLPQTAAPSTGYRDEWLAGGRSLLYFDDPGRRADGKREFHAAIESFEYTEDPERYTQALAVAETPLESLANDFTDQWCTSETFVGQFLGSALALVLGFMLLPAVNLMNLNVSRVLERAPEIGLRKAAGATRGTLVGQFIVENLILTSLGGALSFVVAPFLLELLNTTIVRYGTLSVNLNVFIAGMALVTLFGVFSGAYPAWKMARLDPAQALRGAEYHA